MAGGPLPLSEVEVPTPLPKTLRLDSAGRRVAAGHKFSLSATTVDTQSVATGQQGRLGTGPKQACQEPETARDHRVESFARRHGRDRKRFGRERLPHLPRRLLGIVPPPQVIFADGGYKDVPVSLLWHFFHWTVQIVSRKDAEDRSRGSGFTPLPKRRIVERKFGWLGG